MFEASNVNTLVAWFSTVVLFLYSASHLMSRKWRKYYHFVIHIRDPMSGSRYVWGAPHPRTYGVMWALIAGSLVASMTLWTINYSACNNTYYVTVVALTLFLLVALSMWGPVFIKMKSAIGGLITLAFAWAAAVTALVLMALTVSDTRPGCIADKTGGIVAVVLYGWPILWYTWAAYIQYRWARYVPYDLSYSSWQYDKKNRMKWEQHMRNQMKEPNTYYDDDVYNDPPFPSAPPPKDNFYGRNRGYRGDDYYHRMGEEMSEQPEPKEQVVSAATKNPYTALKKSLLKDQ